MKGLKGLKKILREANKKLKSKNNVESGKITVRLVDQNRLGCYP